MRVVVASRTNALAHARHRATASIDRFTAAANAALSSSANAVGVALSVLASCSRACVATDSKQDAAPVDVPSSRSIIPDAVAARAWRSAPKTGDAKEGGLNPVPPPPLAVWPGGAATPYAFASASRTRARSSHPDGSDDDDAAAALPGPPAAAAAAAAETRSARSFSICDM